MPGTVSSGKRSSWKPAARAVERDDDEAVNRGAGQDYRAADRYRTKNLTVQTWRGAQLNVQEHRRRGDPTVEAVGLSPADGPLGSNLKECTTGGTGQLHLGPGRQHGQHRRLRTRSR